MVRGTYARMPTICASGKCVGSSSSSTRGGYLSSNGIMNPVSGSEVGRLILCALFTVCLASCAEPAQKNAELAQHPVAQPVGMANYDPAAALQTCGLSRVMELWQQRKKEDAGDFAIGPGDVIAISVPELDELQNQQVRVSSDGTIGLSLIGTMQVAGMDENQLRAALVKRLAKFMKYPRVDLFVKRYQARDVAVTGAVQKPGRYDLANMNQSILDMIGRAGGMTADSAQKVIFVPAEAARRFADNRADSNPALPSNSALRTAGYRSAALEENVQHPFGAPGSDTALRNRNWIVINLGAPDTHACLNVPTRPGDVIIVPVAGQVMVQGWVNKPGAFRITPGMTVLGAVSAAGGASFSTAAELVRSDSTGKHITRQFNLSDLADGTEADVPVQSGDVVIVEPTIAGAIPYTLLQILSHFGTGMYLPVP